MTFCFQFFLRHWLIVPSARLCVGRTRRRKSMKLKISQRWWRRKKKWPRKRKINICLNFCHPMRSIIKKRQATAFTIFLILLPHFNCLIGHHLMMWSQRRRCHSDNCFNGEPAKKEFQFVHFSGPTRRVFLVVWSVFGRLKDDADDASSVCCWAIGSINTSREPSFTSFRRCLT